MPDEPIKVEVVPVDYETQEDEMIDRIIKISNGEIPVDVEED